MFFRRHDRATLEALWLLIAKNHDITSLNLSRMEKKLMSMMDDVKAKMDHMDDVVTAVVAVLDELKKAYDYIKNHPVEVVREDPGLKDVADKMDAAAQKLTDAVAKVNVSGSV